MTPHERELDEVLQGDAALRLAEHPQHRAIVEVPVGKVARCDAHGHRREQCGQQRDEVQELLGPIERLPHFGPPDARGFDAHATQVQALDLRLGPIGEVAHRVVAAAGDATAIR